MPTIDRSGESARGVMNAGAARSARRPRPAASYACGVVHLGINTVLLLGVLAHIPVRVGGSGIESVITRRSAEEEIALKQDDPSRPS